MSLLQARKGSNAAKSGGDTAASTGSLAMVGFTEVPYESERPAKSNSEVSSTGESHSLGQDGTSVDAYHFQPHEFDAKSPSALSADSKKQEE